MPQWDVEHVCQCIDVQSVLDCVLVRCLQICGACHGNVQLMDWEAGQLVIKAQYGFQDDFLNFFERVKAQDGTACARALDSPGSIVVEDVLVDKQFLPYRQVMTRAGIRAVQSTVLRSTSGALIGVVSTHFPVCHRPSAAQMRAIGDAARAASNTVIRLRSRTDSNIARRVEDSRKLLQASRDTLERLDGYNHWHRL